jgi:hypothetical protein
VAGSEEMTIPSFLGLCASRCYTSLAVAWHTSTSKEPYYQYPNDEQTFDSGII